MSFVVGVVDVDVALDGESRVFVEEEKENRLRKKAQQKGKTRKEGYYLCKVLAATDEVITEAPLEGIFIGAFFEY